MLGIFKNKPILSQKDTEFQIATYEWLLKNFGGKAFYQHAKIVLPTKEFFPSKLTSPEEAAIETFLMVKKHAGMEAWPCRLEAQDDDIDTRVAPTLNVQNVPQTPLGTFAAKEGDEFVITFNPSVVQNPTQLVATLAHEIAHYLTATAAEEPPGGWDNWEFATDIAATFLGFGVFMANSAFNFQQYTGVDSQGWQSNRSGYLSEAEHLHAFALFLALKGIQTQEVEAYLKPGLRKLLKECHKEIMVSSYVQELSLVEYKPPPEGDLSN